jgi:hypothetical protein
MDAFLLASLPLYLAYCGYAGLQIARRVVPRRHYDEAAARAAAEAGP